jgi:hypothetical protein
MARRIAQTGGPAAAALHIHDFLQHGQPDRLPADSDHAVRKAG